MKPAKNVNTTDSTVRMPSYAFVRLVATRDRPCSPQSRR